MFKGLEWCAMSRGSASRGLWEGKGGPWDLASSSSAPVAAPVIAAKMREQNQHDRRCMHVIGATRQFIHVCFAGNGEYGSVPALSGGASRILV
jgi:hypothetical protein